jgi:hypothetical protein
MSFSYNGNFDSFNIKSSEYNIGLVNHDIDNYFNDLLNKPIPPPAYSIVNKQSYSFSKFYSEYIEHNMLFIVLLIGIVIFLVIRYYVKDMDTELFQPENSSKNTIISKNNNHKKNKDKDSTKITKEQLLNYKKKLDKEKEKIISIIDELSCINNFAQYDSVNKIPNVSYQNNINYTMQSNLPNNTSPKQVNNKYNTFNPNETIMLKEMNSHNYDANTEFYDINRKLDDANNNVNGLYVDPPF